MNNKQDTVNLNLYLRCVHGIGKPDTNVSLMSVPWKFTRYTLSECLDNEHEARFKSNKSFVFKTIELLQPVSENDSILNESKNYCKEHNITLKYYLWYNTDEPKFYNMCD